MDRLKAFLFGTLKIAIALFLVAMAIAGVIWGWDTVSNSRKKAQDAPLAEPKTWPRIKVEAIENANFDLVTMWREGQLYYRFSVDSFPKAIEVARDVTKDRHFTISFLDRNRFKVFTHEVSLGSMAKVVDEKGKGVGLEVNSKVYMGVEDYRNASAWEFVWNFPAVVESAQPTPTQVPPVAKAVPTPPKWRNVALWRQLNRQMSKEDVLKLLGPPTKINNADVLVFWHYGYPLGGEVTFKSDGGIYGWREP